MIRRTSPRAALALGALLLLAGAAACEGPSGAQATLMGVDGPSLAVIPA